MKHTAKLITEESLKQPLNIPTKEGYVLAKDYTYLYERDSKTYTIKIKKGFKYDGASVPRWAWSITGLTPDGLMRGASLLHDIIYVYKGKLTTNAKYVEVRYKNKKVELDFTRKEGDQLFLKMLKDSQMTWLKRNIAFIGVKVGGKKVWKTPQSKQRIKELYI